LSAPLTNLSKQTELVRSAHPKSAHSLEALLRRELPSN
jgi:hypothetical protein